MNRVGNGARPGKHMAQGTDVAARGRWPLMLRAGWVVVRSAVRADPGRFVESAEPVLIDEYQHVPELLDAIKAQLNRDLRPGRYVLAGSTRYAAIPAAAQALTGRVDIIPVLPLTQGEIDGTRETFVARLLEGHGVDESSRQMAATRDEYARRATSGG